MYRTAIEWCHVYFRTNRKYIYSSFVSFIFYPFIQKDVLAGKIETPVVLQHMDTAGQVSVREQNRCLVCVSVCRN